MSDDWANHLRVDDRRRGKALLLLNALRHDGKAVGGFVAIVQLEGDLEGPDEQWVVWEARAPLLPVPAEDHRLMPIYMISSACMMGREREWLGV